MGCRPTVEFSRRERAPKTVSKTERSRARSGRLERYVRRSGCRFSGRHPHAPTTPSWYHTGRTGVRSESRTFGTTPCTTCFDLDSRSAQDSAVHNGQSAQRACVPHLHNGQSAQRACVPGRHNGLWHDGSGTTCLQEVRFAISTSKRCADHVPRTPNGLPISRRERAADHLQKS